MCGIVPRLVGFPYENPLRSSALEATNGDSNFADDEEEAFSSSGVIRLVVGESSRTLSPHLKQNLSLAFTLQPQEFAELLNF